MSANYQSAIALSMHAPSHGVITLKYWLVTIEKRVGEIGSYLKEVFACANDEDIEKYVIKWLSNYFGKEFTRSHGDGAFYNYEESCLVRFSGAQEITKEEYDVLKKYL